jgi:hypothetical protein
MCHGDVRLEPKPVPRRRRPPRRAKDKEADETIDAEPGQAAITSYPLVIERTPDSNAPTAPSSPANSPGQIPATPLDRDGDSEILDPSHSPPE